MSAGLLRDHGHVGTIRRTQRGQTEDPAAEALPAFAPAPVALPPDLRLSTLRIDERELVVLSWQHQGDAVTRAPLSSVEREVLQLLLDGRSNADIARIRKRSLGTVKKQVRAALQKLGVSSRSELTAKLFGAAERLSSPRDRSPTSRG